MKTLSELPLISYTFYKPSEQMITELQRQASWQRRSRDSGAQYGGDKSHQ